MNMRRQTGFMHRLAVIALLAGAVASSRSAETLNAPFLRPEGLTGLWYEPARSGEGYNVLVADPGTLITFFGYDSAGQRLWLVSDTFTGQWAPGVTATLIVYRGNGGNFGGPVPGVNPWGILSARFDSCTAAVFALVGADGTKVSSTVKLAGVKGMAGCDEAPPAADYTAFASPQRVTIRGYDDDAMEPFITRDGRYLLFNNSNAAAVNTQLRYAERVDDLTFDYRGPVLGADSPVLDAVPSLDGAGNLYFISTRSYLSTLSTVYRARFFDGTASALEVISGITEGIPGHLNFDAEIDATGDTLYFVDGVYTNPPVPDSADLAIAVRNAAGFGRAGNSTQLLAAVNTAELEYAPSIADGGLELFFTRYSRGQLGIYRSVRWRSDVAFEVAQRVQAINGFVEAPSLSTDGHSLYYHRMDGQRYAIYRVTR